MSGDNNKTFTILIVDDEEYFRELLKEALDTTGHYNILLASDGIEAQKLLEEISADIAITDLQMPGLDGLSLMKWANERRLKTDWIILSGQGSFHDAVEAVRLGAFDFLTKPLPTIDALKLSVRNILNQRQLKEERDKLHKDLAEKNDQLREQVQHLQLACGLLTHQAQLLDEDIRRAELIQRALLPQAAPTLSGLCIEALYRPCQHVGGDLYDMQLINRRYIVAYIADAAGHGVSAAMLAVLFKNRLEMYDTVNQCPTHPQDVLGRVNRCLIKECQAPALFVTAAYCVLDTETGIMQLGSAGHPPVILQRADGEIVTFEATGPGLGIRQDAEYSQHEIAFGKDDRLLLYTDGLTTASQKEPLATDDISELLKNQAKSGENGLLGALHREARKRQNGEQEDDITLMMLTGANGQSAVDNGKIREQVVTPVDSSNQAELMYGFCSHGYSMVIEVIGRGTWTQSQTFHDKCLQALKQRRSIRISLGKCTYMDSTFLGTIQELTELADHMAVDLDLEEVAPELKDQFVELGMTTVIDHITTAMLPLPQDMEPVPVRSLTTHMSGQRMLTAHKALAALSPDNRKEFQELIEQLQRELASVSSPAPNPHAE